MTYRFQKPRRTHTEDVDESLGLQQQQVGRNLNALIRKKSSEWKVLDEAANCFISASGLNFQLNLSTVDVVRLEMCQALSVRNLESIEFASFIREDISIFNYISWADKKNGNRTAWQCQIIVLTIFRHSDKHLLNILHHHCSIPASSFRQTRIAEGPCWRRFL